MVETYRALIVEDDAVAREAAVIALQDQGFQCASAADGAKACTALEQSNYDVVVTDLRLPRRNGHSLAVELSQRAAPRPLVVVLTGVLDGRLVKDLIARGVDDVAFKPVDFGAFGAKVRALCDRRRRQESLDSSRRELADVVTLGDSSLERVTAAEIERRLDSLAAGLPVSAAALEVAQLIKGGKPSAAVVAKAISNDPLLTVEVLRLANSARIHPSGRRIESLVEAVTWIGDRQIGELAIASTTLGAVSKVRMPWIDPEQLWRHSIAGSRAMQHLQPAAEVGAEEEGLFLSSLILPLSRVVLSMAFPELYEPMLAHCQRFGSTLAELERRVFCVSPGRAMAGVLARWKLSPALCKPLQQAASSYAEIACLTEPLRSKVERLKVADFLGQLANGQFEPWCEIDFPPAETMSRLRIEDPASIVEQVRAELRAAHARSAKSEEPRLDRLQPAAMVPYFKLAVDCRDLLTVLLQAMNLKIERISRSEACHARPCVVHCLDVSSERLEWFLVDAVPETKRVLFTSASHPCHDYTWSHVVQLPCSFHVFSKAVEMASTAS